MGTNKLIDFDIGTPSLEYKECDFATGKLLLIELNGSVVKTFPVYGKLTKSLFTLYNNPAMQKDFIKLYNFDNVEQVFLYEIPSLFCFEITIKKNAQLNENQILCASTSTERNDWIELFYKFKVCNGAEFQKKEDVSNKFFIGSNNR